MKRLVKLSLLPLLVVTLTSCMGYLDDLINSGSLPISQGTSNPSGTKTIAQVLTILANEGYVNMDENNNASQDTYYEGLINTNYGLDLDVTGFYQGYVPSYTRWTMVVVFGSISDAASYFQALQNDETNSSYLWLEGNIVIETASYDTYLLIV